MLRLDFKQFKLLLIILLNFAVLLLPAGGCHDG